MADRAWADDTVTYHAEAALNLDRLAARAGWRPWAGRTCSVCTRRRTRRRPRTCWPAHMSGPALSYSDRWLRLGIPGSRDEFARVGQAMTR
ncbi:hypothetical protein FLP41_08335 [Paracoccus marcusii]|uniref:hypothetical protein n=1 Tax=Paracoccus marcusii TaxID=59779 RepID=UPI002ED0A193|nr:hypothetical protein FLP41_08335 [Paracoccus marcusii]